MTFLISFFIDFKPEWDEVNMSLCSLEEELIPDVLVKLREKKKNS